MKFLIRFTRMIISIAYYCLIKFFFNNSLSLSLSLSLQFFCFAFSFFFFQSFLSFSMVLWIFCLFLSFVIFVFLVFFTFIVINVFVSSVSFLFLYFFNCFVCLFVLILNSCCYYYYLEKKSGLHFKLYSFFFIFYFTKQNRLRKTTLLSIITDTDFILFWMGKNSPITNLCLWYHLCCGKVHHFHWCRMHALFVSVFNKSKK